MHVDVITAVHAAHARYLRCAWASLRAQDYGAWSWVVQVDGPVASVLAALTECGAYRDCRVRVDAHDTREGPAVTRNIALGRTRAPLVQNLDADDELEPHALSVLAGALRTNPAAGFAVGHARDLLPGGALRRHPLPIRPGVLQQGALLEAWLANTGNDQLPVHPAGVMWRQALLCTLGGWSALNAMEDTGLLIAATAISPGVHVDSPTLRYRKHAGQRSTKRSKFRGGGAQIALIRRRAELLQIASREGG